MRIIAIVLIFTSSLSSQQFDNTWIIGGSSVNGVFDGWQWGTMLGNFQTEPFTFVYDSSITLDMDGTATSISDNAGKLLMYSSGMSVHNGKHMAIPGLDTISYGGYWENWNLKNYLPDGTDWVTGFPIRKGVMMLPSFVPNEFIIFSILRTNPSTDTFDTYRTTRLLTSEVRFDSQYPDGLVLYKEKTLLDGFFQGGFSACRHANGRDWWIVHNAEFNTAIYVFLYTPDGVTLKHTFTGVTPVIQRQTFVVGNFSTLGSKYVTAESIGINEAIVYLTVYQFDRCTGLLQREEFKTISPQNILFGAVAFSLDDHYLYVTNGLNMYQYDLTSNLILATEKIIATYDGSLLKLYPEDPGEDLIFSTMTLGPDGRIYCIPPGGVRSVHTIEFPDENGKDAYMIQNKLIVPTQIFNSLPSFPNYRLGPLDGSVCDTLGLDNHPIAKYRYEPDSIDYKWIRFTDLSYFRPEIWSWDFGDGSPKISKRSPYHTYAQNGIYKVCLTVSNENSSNTFCRDITIGPSAVDDHAEHQAEVTLFPNPVQDMLLVTIGEYIPERGYIELYNISGRQVHQQRAYYGHNNVDMSGLAAGTYVLRVMDGSFLVKEEKVVKVD